MRRAQWSALLLAACGAAAAALLAETIRLWIGYPRPLLGVTDFSAEYCAVRMVLAGHASWMYSFVHQLQCHAALGAPVGNQNNPFLNPPSSLFLVLPFARLSTAAAYRAWSIVQACCTLGTVLWIVQIERERIKKVGVLQLGVLILAIAGSTAFALLVLEGQWDGLDVFALGVYWWGLRRGHPIVGGGVLGILGVMTKPHLFFGIAAFIIGTRSFRTVAAAAVGGAASFLAGAAFGGVGNLVGFFHASVVFNPLPDSLGWLGATTSWLGMQPASWILTGIGCFIFIMAPWGLGHAVHRKPAVLPLAFSGAVASSLLLAPHVLVHDCILLALPFAVLALQTWEGVGLGNHAVRAVPLPAVAYAGWFLLIITTRFDLGNTTQSLPGRLTPLVLAAIAIGCMALIQPTLLARKGKMQDQRAAPT